MTTLQQLQSMLRRYGSHVALANYFDDDEHERLSASHSRKAEKVYGELEDSLSFLVEDAERYRWLRDVHGVTLAGHDFVSFNEVSDQRIDQSRKESSSDGAVE